MSKTSAAVSKTGIDEKTLQGLPIGVMLFDLEKIYFANKTAGTILGLRTLPKDISKFSVFNFIEKSYHNESKAYFNKILSKKKVSRREIILVTSKGKRILVASETNVVFQNGNKMLQCAFSELPESRLQATQSKSALDLLQKISANSQDVIFHYSFEPRNELKFISDSAKQTLGYEPSEIFSKPSLLISSIHKEDRELLQLNAKHYTGKGRQRTKKEVVRFLHKDELYRHLEVAINTIYDRARKLTGIICNMRDITDRIETENLLLETKNKFDLITNNGNDIIIFYTYNPAEKYLYVSPNIKKILGFEVSDVMKDKNFLQKRLIGGNEDYHRAEQLMRKYQKSNTIRNFQYSFKLLDNKKREVWLENNLVPITDKNNKITFYINILRDITEQKESDLAIETQYNNYRNLLDNSPVAYIIHDHGVCLYANKALLSLLKLKAKNQILGKFAVDFFEPGERKRALQRIQGLYTNPKRKAKFYNYLVRDFEGSQVEVEIKSVPIKFNDRDCILSLVNNLNEQRQREREKIRVLITETANKQLQKEIHERQEVEKNLTEKSAHLSSIFESSTHLIWTVNDKYELTSFNQNFEKTVRANHGGVSIRLGLRVDEVLQAGKNEYILYWYGKYAEAFKGKKLEFVKEDNLERPLYRKIHINPIFNKNGAVTEISCIANDITDSKIYEQKLIQQTGKLSAIFDSSHHYIWTIDRDGKLTSFNKNYYELVTALYNTKPFLGLVLNRGVLANDREYTDLLNYHYDKAFKGLATSFEIQTKDKDAKSVYLEIFLNPIIENGVVAEVSGIAHNTTDKKHVQQRMEQSLKEKEVLLREVHHRVKNNMQVISSILNLQSSYVQDESTLALLKESQNRIKTMAYIHESLYQNKSFTNVNFSEYVNTLVNNIVQSYAFNNEKIKLKINIEKITLSLDSSIPAGLIINELITNAIKHAFPGSRQGTIEFGLRTENNYVFLELKDDGVGFAPGVDFENSHSLGLQLVNTLIEQIEGQLRFKSELNKGTEVFIIFKM